MQLKILLDFNPYESINSQKVFEIAHKFETGFYQIETQQRFLKKIYYLIIDTEEKKMEDNKYLTQAKEWLNQYKNFESHELKINLITKLTYGQVATWLTEYAEYCVKEHEKKIEDAKKPKEEFKITEPGFYKCRDGSKATVHFKCSHKETLWPWVGEAKEYGQLSWTEEGFEFSDLIQNGDDIIAKWED